MRTGREVPADGCQCSRAAPSEPVENSDNSELRRISSFPITFWVSDDGAVLKRDSYDSDSTHYLHSYRDHHRAVTGLWLTSLHDGKRGTRQVSQGASCLGRHQPLLDIRNRARAFAAVTCGRASAFRPTRTCRSAAPYPTTRTHGRAGAFLQTRNP